LDIILQTVTTPTAPDPAGYDAYDASCDNLVYDAL